MTVKFKIQEIIWKIVRIISEISETVRYKINILKWIPPKTPKLPFTTAVNTRKKRNLYINRSSLLWWTHTFPNGASLAAIMKGLLAVILPPICVSATCLSLLMPPGSRLLPQEGGNAPWYSIHSLWPNALSPWKRPLQLSTLTLHRLYAVSGFLSQHEPLVV